MRLLALLALVLIPAGCGGTGSVTNTHPQQTAAAPLRTVLVGRKADRLPPETKTLVPVVFEGGAMPSAPGTATVLTDSSCEPDAQGMSHCLNTLSLPDGTSMVVRHNHRMSEFPCLSPGESVALKLA